MQITIKVGNVLTEAADVLFSTANPWLNLSGGVNGAIREVVGPELQSQIHQFLRDQGVAAVPAGTVVRSDPFGLAFKHVLHVVAIDPFYDSSIELVKVAFARALDMAVDLSAESISTPTLATGYGPMSISDFGIAIAPLLDDPRFAQMSLNIVLRRDEDAANLRESLSQVGVQVTE
jgi:O-acetyl-ADP-ribose deacetylase